MVYLTDLYTADRPSSTGRITPLILLAAGVDGKSPGMAEGAEIYSVSLRRKRGSVSVFA